jgi:hypothetical protein
VQQQDTTRPSDDKILVLLFRADMCALVHPFTLAHFLAHFQISNPLFQKSDSGLLTASIAKERASKPLEADWKQRSRGIHEHKDSGVIIIYQFQLLQVAV